MFLQAFYLIVNDAYKLKSYNNTVPSPPDNPQLLKNIALFSQLLMFRDIEIIFWASLNTAADIERHLEDNLQ